MTNLIDIQGQIQKLQKQADEIKAKEFDRTLKEILAQMGAFGISIKDIQVAAKGGNASKKGSLRKKVMKSAGKKSVKGTVVAPKFRGPLGESWSGRGLTPRWLSSLVAQGKSKEDFAV
jgi:DNA-binding protein H-NS